MAYPPLLQGLELAASSVDSIVLTQSYDHVESIRTLTTTEQTVRAIFSTILNLPEDKIGLETPLYALGLDSVAAIQIAAKCRNEFGLNIAVADVFVGETITGICQAYDVHHVSTDVVAPRSQANLVTDEDKFQALNLLGVTEDMVDHILPVLPVSPETNIYLTPSHSITGSTLSSCCLVDMRRDILSARVRVQNFRYSGCGQAKLSLEIAAESPFCATNVIRCDLPFKSVSSGLPGTQHRAGNCPV